MYGRMRRWYILTCGKQYYRSHFCSFVHQHIQQGRHCWPGEEPYNAIYNASTVMTKGGPARAAVTAVSRNVQNNIQSGSWWVPGANIAACESGNHGTPLSILDIQYAHTMQLKKMRRRSPVEINAKGVPALYALSMIHGCFTLHFVQIGM